MPENRHNPALEARLSALEHHLIKLLQWQKGIASLSTGFAVVRELGSHDVTPDHTDAEKGSLAKLETWTRQTIPTAPTITIQPAEIIQTVEPAKELLAVAAEEFKQTAVDPNGALEAIYEAIPPILEKASTRIAYEVLNKIQSYGQHLQVKSEVSTEESWIGKSMFVARVEKQIELDQPIKMILPSFPWKSINRTEKVNGHLPDLGEVLALARLQNLCTNIGMTYHKGAELTIATDGLVFDDLVGIPDEDTWAYSEALMEIAVREGFNNVKLIRPMSLLELTDDGKLTRAEYLKLTVATRKALEEQYGKSAEEVRSMITTDADTLMTYRGFIRFLETDLKYSPMAGKAGSGSQYRKCVKKTAMDMMRRAESFTKLIQAKCLDYVRLSIHPSSGGVKLSVPLIPQRTGEFPKTPWHCTIAVGLDGSYRTVHVKDVRDTHNLIYHNKQPYYYREKSDLWDWDDDRVVFEPQYPQGLLVRPRAGAEEHLSLTAEQLDKLGQLAQLQSPVTVVDFVNAADAVFTAPAKRDNPSIS